MYRNYARSPVAVLIFSLITCGIYHFYWIYKVSQETQEYTARTTVSPGAELLLCIFTCGIYYIYWNYKYGKVIAECQSIAGLYPEDNSILYLILSIVGLGMISALIMQSSLNKVWERA